MVLLALSTMPAGWQAFFFVLAFILAVLATAGARWPKVNLLAAAFAAFVLVLAWNALAAA